MTGDFDDGRGPKVPVEGVQQNEEIDVNDKDRGTCSVEYDTENHVQVLCQMHGSVWLSVLPMCAFNAALAVTVFLTDIDDRFNINLSVTDKGHVFMSLMVSYLVISRLSNSLGRYMDARMYLSDLMRSSRELVQQAVAFTRYDDDGYPDPDKSPMLWRVDVAKRTISQLKAMVNYLRYPSCKKNVWESDRLTKLEKTAVVWAVGSSNERAPFVLNIFLRTVIASHIEKLNKPLEVVQELVLLGFTSDIIEAYTRIIKDVNTPYPFPLVQMTRTFLFMWVFSLPLALANDIEKLCPLIFVTFFLTYGFLGLEIISIEMDDPYGTDPNDFNVEFLAERVYNDIYVSIEDIDGNKAVDKVRRAMKKTEQSFRCHPTDNEPSGIPTDHIDSNEEDDDVHSHLSPPRSPRRPRTWRSIFQRKVSPYIFGSKVAPKYEQETSEPEKEHLLNEIPAPSPSRRDQFLCSNHTRQHLSLERPGSLSIEKREESLDISGILVNGAAEMNSSTSIEALSPNSEKFKFERNDDGETLSLRPSCRSRQRDSDIQRLSVITDHSVSMSIAPSASNVSGTSRNSYNSARSSESAPGMHNKMPPLRTSLPTSEIVQESSRDLLQHENSTSDNDDGISYSTSRDVESLSNDRMDSDNIDNDDDDDDSVDDGLSTSTEPTESQSSNDDQSDDLLFRSSSLNAAFDNDSNISCASDTPDTPQQFDETIEPSTRTEREFDSMMFLPSNNSDIDRERNNTTESP
eukprot:CAMPEP_0203662776 /NCGR_PEP_ID=MMETSP0090-20130426/624_1 /ASSEMBLY_ACC=CAM_ASM_001088 /TAXON_ID=426623 /ORGANISM="Chaetoceros affinis, Strain CCMP159" /LENGTH=742 /DNA_ID=CAMNT_0050525611 /DNA_START=194 /DNA_END=2422 /DNA_ORIENTATION=-